MPRPAEAFGGLAFRFGRLVWWSDDEVHISPSPSLVKDWAKHTRTVKVPLKPHQFGLFPPVHALQLAHGAAYLVGQGPPTRLMIDENATAEPLMLQSYETSDGFNDFGDFDESEAARRPHSHTEEVWDAHDVDWWGQATTQTRWLAVGRYKGTLVAAEASGADALFCGRRLGIPVLPPDTWREVLAWNDTFLLRTTTALWREDLNAGWSEWLRIPPGNTFEGIVQPDQGSSGGETTLWIWGYAPDRVWIQRLNEFAEVTAELSLPRQPSDKVFPHPIVNGTRVTFFRSSAGYQLIETLDASRPFDQAHRQEIAAGEDVVWATALRFEDMLWVLYGADDGSHARFYLWQATATSNQAQGQLLHWLPRRGAGATIAATIADGCFALAATKTDGTKLHVFALEPTSTDLSPVVNARGIASSADPPSNPKPTTTRIPSNPTTSDANKT